MQQDSGIVHPATQAICLLVCWIVIKSAMMRGNGEDVKYRDSAAQ